MGTTPSPRARGLTALCLAVSLICSAPPASAEVSATATRTAAAAVATHAAAVAPVRYRVLAGDTIAGIGRKTHHDRRDIASWNNLLPPYRLTVGSVLRLTSPDGLTGFKYSIHRVDAAELGASYHAGCPVAPVHLRRISMYFVGFDGQTHKGQLVVRDTATTEVVRIFNSLYNARFPVRRMQPTSVYGGSDYRSMAANNTSAFNCRPVAGTSRWSQHSYGTAVDLNPVQNPWVSGNAVEPAAGRKYLNRQPYRTGMVIGAGTADRAFDAEGWGWGGDWKNPIDYQHFSVNGR